MIKKFQEFIKENVDELSDSLYDDILSRDIEQDDDLREYCPCEEGNTCNCDGMCDCKFCELYRKKMQHHDILIP